MSAAPPPYTTRLAARSTFLELRGLRHHVLQWGDASLASDRRPPLVLVHGWMDVAASFQFLVDALDAAGDAPRWIVAPDWRGFGLSEPGGSDSYWFADYLGDLDALLHALCPAERFEQVDLLGHSMGGNVAMSYAGVRPQRIRRLVNLEGFGLPRTEPQQAPQRLEKWLDDLRQPQALRSYASLQEVAARLMQNNPRLPADKAAWLAPHWAALRDDGRWHVLGDPAHKRSHAVPYRVDEVLATWQRIAAPVLVVQAEGTDAARWWGTRYTLQEFAQRLEVVRQVQRLILPDAGHMLHHDQPDALAAALAAFLR